VFHNGKDWSMISSLCMSNFVMWRSQGQSTWAGRRHCTLQRLVVTFDEPGRW